jgi:hypothetical protein
MRSFSGCVMLQPGDCSPSRSVVSKIMTRFGSRWDMVFTVEKGGAGPQSGVSDLRSTRACVHEVPRRPFRSDARGPS